MKILTEEHKKKMQEGRKQSTKPKEKRLSIARAIKANCAECTGFFADGRKDCNQSLCPFHEWMPYKDSESVLWWVGVTMGNMRDAYTRARRAIEEVMC